MNWVTKPFAEMSSSSENSSTSNPATGSAESNNKSKQTNLQRIQQRKAALRRWPMAKKTEKLAIYSSCKADASCKCSGWKNPHPAPNPPRPDASLPSASLEDPCRSCGHSLSRHVAHLKNGYVSLPSTPLDSRKTSPERNFRYNNNWESQSSRSYCSSIVSNSNNSSRAPSPMSVMSERCPVANGSLPRNFSYTQNEESKRRFIMNNFKSRSNESSHEGVVSTMKRRLSEKLTTADFERTVLKQYVRPVQDSFRDKDAREWKKLKAQLDVINKNCRNYQLKLRKAQLRTAELKVKNEELSASMKSEKAGTVTKFAIAVACLVAGYQIISKWK
ncbi:PCAF [Lepeophtheirus salmonis]|uniref:PCAF n=1 Tax=Lepeophtheirus salmonis TaxID=72036 RepID=A0A7R8CFY5_LEPSM|nr:PCAF [Lepeophtheirus salmonis]CAF2810707.1 PCAF [Lepeophtheirus salmonis]